MISRLRQLLRKYNRIIFSSKLFKFSFHEIECLNKLIAGKKAKGYVYNYVDIDKYY